MPFLHSLRPGLALAPFFLALSPTVAGAQQTPEPSVPTLSDIVVTASRQAEPLADTVGDVSVIRRDTLQKASGDSVAEILGRTPGVQFTTNGGPQTTTGLFIRGTSASQSLVLLNGVRINSAITGASLFPVLDPSQLERVEILRGSASSLYGSNALGGVVNLITRTPQSDEPLSAWANLGYGSYATGKTSLGLSGASHGWDYSLSGSANTSRGFDATRKHLANGSSSFVHYKDKDGYRSHAWSGTLGYAWAPGHRVGLTAFNGYSKADFDSADYNAWPIEPLDNVTSVYRQQVYALSSQDQLTDWWESVLQYSWAKESNESRQPLAADDSSLTSALTASIRQTLSWQNNWRLTAQQRLSLLAEHETERIQANSTFDRRARQTNALGLIYKAHFGDFHLQASARNDNYTGYGNKATGSLALDYDLNDHWQVGVAANTGFRMPTFSDMYQNLLAYYYVGNPNLKPESSRNLEAHLTYEDEATQVSLTLYRNRIRDLIAYVSDPDTFLGTMDNINRATLQGLTLAARHQFDQTALYASLDLLDPRNDDPKAGEGSALPRRARQVLHAGVEHQLHNWTLGAEYQYTGNRYDDPANQVRLGGYSLVNLSAEYAFSKSLALQVRWNNVLDKQYVLVDGYNTPGSNVFVNLSWRTP